MALDLRDSFECFFFSELQLDDFRASIAGAVLLVR